MRFASRTVPYGGLCETVGPVSREAPLKEKGRCVQRPKMGVLALAEPCRAAKATALRPDSPRYRCWREAWLLGCASDIQPAAAIKTPQLRTVQDTQPGRQRRSDPALDRAEPQRARFKDPAQAQVNNPCLLQSGSMPALWRNRAACFRAGARRQDNSATLNP